jgi:putative ABC transport system permease protein
MRVIRQIAGVTAMNLQSLPQRLRPSIVVVVGIAGVVAVLVSMLGMATGLGRMANSGARSDRAVVLSAGANVEQVSLLNQDMVTAIVNAAGVRRDQNSKPLVSPEVLLTASLPGQGSDEPADVPFRGIGPMGFAVHPEFEIVAGRSFNLDHVRGLCDRRHHGARCDLRCADYRLFDGCHALH